MAAAWKAVKYVGYVCYCAFGVFMLGVMAAAVYYIVYPETGLTMSDVKIDVSDGQLALAAFTIENASSYGAVKGPVIACDMKGPSGTTIRTATHIIYIVLPSHKMRSFSSLQMSEVPDQATAYNCYIKGAKSASLR